MSYPVINDLSEIVLVMKKKPQRLTESIYWFFRPRSGSQGSEGLTESSNYIGHPKVTSLPLLDHNPQIWARKFPVLICSQSPQVLGGDEKASELHGAPLVPLHNQISSSMQRILVLLVLCSILLFISCCATSIAANL